ncbi:hypothetical protein [Saccharopolyspora sp. 7B]|uniref:hypothetical protein n=1 Tax=Saccharopolyspora sp. 7B TaxID=2877240 RepID=UPI001CD64CA9|nr:hypothetical protein [Saccharopolyspora sp. 7B]MCA1278911.1 hypothetical protein [Saccharopolyspora sp. 7B]
MFGMPVLRNAVLTSPQGSEVTAWRPDGNGTSRCRQPIGTVRSSPSMRARPPSAAPSSALLSVPPLIPPLAWNARSRVVAVGSAAATSAARQSVGTTSNPDPGSSTTPAFAASSCRAATDSNTSISPVMST